MWSILFSVLLLWMGSVRSRVPFYPHLGMVIELEDADEIQPVLRHGECRLLCLAAEECRMASAVERKGGPNGILDCRMVKKINLDLLTPKNHSVTWTTPHHTECKNSYTLVPGVGCINIPEETVTHADASNLCQHDSVLFSPVTLGIFENLRQYLLKAKESGSVGTGMWIGVNRNTSGAYVWNSGGYIAGPDPREPFHGVRDSYPFGASEKGEETGCVGVFYSKDEAYRYHLFDGFCTTSQSVICQLR